MMIHKPIHCRIGIFLIAVLLTLPLWSQENGDISLYQGITFDKSIHTVKVFRKGWPLSAPYLNLSDDVPLILSFDDLADDTRDFSYRIIHCNANWTPSDLFVQDYLDGFYDNPVTDYDYSVNTTVPYIHYRLSFPNDDLHIKLSGNYIIAVYENDKIVLSQRFVVFENLVSIQPSMVQGNAADFPGGGQEILFDVTTSSFPVTDPARDITAVIIQNENRDGAQIRTSPDAIRGNTFSYGLNSDITFPGGNEFRHFEISDIRFASKNVADIRYSAPYYNVLLEKAAFRRFKPYISEEDLNGRFLIRNNRGTDPGTDADYLNVFFTLDAPFPVEGSEVYVFGGLSGWQISPEFRMKYNLPEHQYELSLLLKQGHYDYLFATVTKDGKPDLTRLEGSYFETGNDYTIILYYRPPGADYDRIIGLRTFNSRNNQ